MENCPKLVQHIRTNFVLISKELGLWSSYYGPPTGSGPAVATAIGPGHRGYGEVMVLDQSVRSAQARPSVDGVGQQFTDEDYGIRDPRKARCRRQ